VAGTKSDRNNALALDRENAGFAAQVANDVSVGRTWKGYGHVPTLYQIELNVDHVIDGITPKQSEDHHRHGKGDSHDRQRGADGPPSDVAKDHDSMRLEDRGQHQPFNP
jgi:hypothetical protein